MAAQDQKRQPGTNGGDEASPATKQMKREAPMSDSIMKELDTAVKESSKQDTFEKRKRRILERCGCL